LGGASLFLYLAGLGGGRVATSSFRLVPPLGMGVEKGGPLVALALVLLLQACVVPVGDLLFLGIAGQDFLARSLRRKLSSFPKSVEGALEWSGGLLLSSRIVGSWGRIPRGGSGLRAGLVFLLVLVVLL